MPEIHHINGWIVVLLGAAAILAACTAAPTTLPAEPSQTPTMNPTSTPTIVWFPATATPTIVSAQVNTPTPDERPSPGEILLKDDFSTGDSWNLSQTSSSSVALGKNNLSLALNMPGGYLYTLRDEPLLGDFYLEITASVSLCRTEDEYGLLLRVTPNLDFYRFSLSCDGRVRLDKYYEGRASSPVPWMYSGAVPPGAPSSSRLAVWAIGREIRFYVNQEYQFTLSDPSLIQGTLGLFARSAGDTAVTVTFSELIIRDAE